MVDTTSWICSRVIVVIGRPLIYSDAARNAHVQRVPFWGERQHIVFIHLTGIADDKSSKMVWTRASEDGMASLARCNPFLSRGFAPYGEPRQCCEEKVSRSAAQ